MVTTFEIFQRLLDEAIDDSTSLTTNMKTELKARVDALVRTQLIELGAGNVASSTDVTVSEANDSITVANGDAGVVVFDLHTFATPVRVLGIYGVMGALVGHIGQGTNTVVANADITIHYRYSTSGTWRAFARNVVLSDVNTIQFQVTTTAQVGDHDLPKLQIVTEQQ